MDGMGRIGEYHEEIVLENLLSFFKGNAVPFLVAGSLVRIPLESHRTDYRAGRSSRNRRPGCRLGLPALRRDAPPSPWPASRSRSSMGASLRELRREPDVAARSATPRLRQPSRRDAPRRTTRSFAGHGDGGASLEGKASSCTAPSRGPRSPYRARYPPTVRFGMLPSRGAGCRGETSPALGQVLLPRRNVGCRRKTSAAVAQCRLTIRFGKLPWRVVRFPGSLSAAMALCRLPWRNVSCRGTSSPAVEDCRLS